MELKEYDLDYDDMVQWRDNFLDNGENEFSADNMIGIGFSDIMDVSINLNDDVIEEWAETLNYLHDTLNI